MCPYDGQPIGRCLTTMSWALAKHGHQFGTLTSITEKGATPWRRPSHPLPLPRRRTLSWNRAIGSREPSSTVATAHGLIESEVFPGLRLDVKKLLAGDAAGVLAALDADVAPETDG